MPVVIFDEPRLDSPQAVSKFWRDVATRISKREPRMPVAKSLSDLAWQAFSSTAQALVDAKQYRTLQEAIDGLKAQNHPAYMVYLGSLSSSTAPAPATGDVVKVVKQAQEVQFAKRRQVQTEMNKRAAALVRGGQAENELEAMKEVFKRDPALYEEYRKTGYGSGPLFPDTAPAPAVAPEKPAYAMAKRMALELKQDDPYGAHAGASETELIEKVFTANPALYEAVRQESYSRL